MPQTPEFATTGEYVACLEDVDFWWPYASAVLDRHGLAESATPPRSGTEGTYPTVLCGDLVVKFFGHVGSWIRAYEGEHDVLATVGTDPEISAPRVMGTGFLDPARDCSWLYLIMSAVPGIPWAEAGLSYEERLTFSAELGRRIHRVHGLPVTREADQLSPISEVVAAARHSSLPAHLVAQIADFVPRWESDDRVLVHGDLIDRHVFVDKGQLTGIIDWGDAIVVDRHYELIQAHRDLFGCDTSLLRAFLAASDWPVERDFPRRALAYALHRQSVGLARHLTMDVFEPVAAVLPLNDIATLDELADVLFGL